MRNKRRAIIGIVGLFIILLTINGILSQRATYTRNTPVGYIIIEAGTYQYYQSATGIPSLAVVVSPPNPIVNQEVEITLIPQLRCVPGVAVKSAYLFIQHNNKYVYEEDFSKKLPFNPCTSSYYNIKFTPRFEGQYIFAVEIIGSDGNFLGFDEKSFFVTKETPSSCGDQPPCTEDMWRIVTVENCQSWQIRICTEIIRLTNGQCSERNKPEEQRTITTPSCTQEICNGLDDDRDGSVDENPDTLCPEGTVCRDFQCKSVEDISNESPETSSKNNTKTILIIGGIILIIIGFVMNRKR